MTLFNNKYRIESNRLKGCDYSKPGYYFITICTKNRERSFGDIKNGEMVLSGIGKIADQYWREIPVHFNNVGIDVYIIMPNHIHGIIDIDDRRDAINRVSTGINVGGITKNHNPMLNDNSIPKIIRWFKGRCTYEINKINGYNFHWQSRYYDRIIRNKKELHQVCKYISENPGNWNNDDLYMKPFLVE